MLLYDRPILARKRMHVISSFTIALTLSILILKLSAAFEIWSIPFKTKMKVEMVLIKGTGSATIPISRFYVVRQAIPTGLAAERFNLFWKGQIGKPQIPTNLFRCLLNN